MTAVAALSFGGLITSCTKDTDFSGGATRSNQDVQKTYEEAFLTTFGRPVEGLDWGFGLNTTASTRAMTRTLQPSHNFSNDIPSKPTTNEMAATNFKENVDGIDPYPNGGYAIGTSYITGSIDVNIWGGGETEDNGWQKSGGVVYLSGTCNMSGKSVYICDNTIIYIVKGAQVTLDNGFQGNCKVYIAEGAKLTINNSIGTGNVSYYIKGGSFEAKNNLVVNGGKEFFVEDGNVKVGGLMQIQNATYYAKNTPLSIDGYLDLVNGDNPALFYNEGGTITCENELKNNSSKYYSSGNSKFKEIEGNGISVIYNAGSATMESEGIIRVTNSNGDGTNGSVLINDGTLKGTYLGTEGSSFFQNNGTTTISGGTETENGRTVINSNNNTWVNNNQYITEYFEYTAGSSEVINNCNLTVNEDFYMNISDGSGDFKIDSNGGVLTKNFYGGGTINGATAGPFKITMGARSVFKVTNDCYLDATAAGIATYGYGFQGVGVGENNAAVLDAKYVKNHGNPGHGYVAYSGNLYISAESHFAQGTADASDGASYIIFKDGCSVKNIYAPGFEDGKPSIKISPTSCNPGFNGDVTPPGPGVDPDASEVIVIAEDLSTYISSDGKELADFDFNDVVFEVRKGNGMVHIKLLAAGGTLPLTVGGEAGETELDQGGNEVLKYEVHRRFKVSTGTMVNTNSTTSGATRDPVEFDIPYPDGVTSASTIYAIANAIPIRVYRTDLNTNSQGWIEIQKAEEVSSSATRITASKLCVDKTYIWCDERVHIDNEFPYTDAYGNNKGSRFRMYLSGELKNYWWKETTTVESD